MIYLDPATAIIGGLLLIAIGLLVLRGERISRNRIRRTTADEQALNASIRRHPSSPPARIPGQWRPS